VALRVPATFETARLRADPIAMTDEPWLRVLHHDERVMATLGGIRSDEETRRFLEEKLTHWRERGFGMWVFRSRDSGEPVGRGGLQHMVVENVPEVEVGYTVGAEDAGRGYATEMTDEMASVGFRDLGLASIVAFTLPTNLASRRVMEKTGFTFERDIDHAGYRQVLYRRTAPR
jgi:RimJ/RimL family protein N-acetyltransferase